MSPPQVLTEDWVETDLESWPTSHSVQIVIIKDEQTHISIPTAGMVSSLEPMSRAVRMTGAKQTPTTAVPVLTG